MTKYIAELNIARVRADMDNLIMRGFIDGIASVNAQAEASDGFIWRDCASLKAFMYGELHAYYMKGRREWFHKMDSPHSCLWWVNAGHQPSLTEAKAKLDALTAHGPSEAVFTFAEMNRLPG
ncbi:DUF3291 domain-containing protein [Litorivicinus lipolyticus]|uniref:DUF3291 domain-containing protein n=1 Tax=Litorivicinus lipolyticus TaxID=418701 RepID=A0A5Q2QEQ5_9GAMM|nr:DUF3291 domain-containing protein [Litorivicinus lipolyticus]QGG80812.1 DUF3291 domain-containing protein [Litorivicinus lipolyticus]